MGGPKPKPAAQKIAEGVIPSRINNAEPQFPLDTNPGGHSVLDVVGLEEWKRVYPELTRGKVLTVCDRQILLGYCIAFQNMIKAEKALQESGGLVFVTDKGAIMQTPYVSMVRGFALAMMRLAETLGMTPSARSKIVIAGNGEDEDDEFLNRNLKRDKRGNNGKQALTQEE